MENVPSNDIIVSTPLTEINRNLGNKTDHHTNSGNYLQRKLLSNQGNTVSHDAIVLLESPCHL